MSIAELKSDLERNLADFNGEAFLTADDVKKYLKDTLWPFIANMAVELEDVDGCIGSILDETEDILHEETAKVLAAVVVGSKMMVAELAKRLVKHSPADQKLAQWLKSFKPTIQKAGEIIEEITIQDEEEEVDEATPDTAEASAEEAEAGGEE